MAAFTLVLLGYNLAVADEQPSTQVVNGDAGGATIRFDARGNALDAHDGEIERFGNTYYLYGTSYGCGFRWQSAGTPFCGFHVYSSPDLVQWTDRGALFDASTPQWQARCDGATYGCYRPHVVHNAATGQYVLWINTYDVPVGYHVFTSASPIGPFTEQAVPHLGVNDAAPVGVNNGDEDVFVDQDGTAYLTFTDWRAGGELVVAQLDASYLSGTGRFVRLGTRSTEAPSMFRRGDTYYVTYSDPNCGFCTTGTSYLRAPSPLGPWTGSATSADTWTIRDGALSVDGGGIGLSRAGADWTDYTMSFRTTPLPTGGGGKYAQAGWVFRASDTGTGYAWLLGNYPYPGAAAGSLTKVIFRGGGVVSAQVVPLPFSIVSGQSYQVATTVAGDRITTVVNGVTVDTTTDATFGAGRVGFRESGGSDSESALFDDVRVTAPDGTVLLADDFSGSLAQWDRPAPVVLGTNISRTSCGGQPADVAQLPARSGPVYLYQSDRWNNGAPNEGLALHYWEPLQFDAAGAIQPLRCGNSYDLDLAGRQAPKPPAPSASVETAGDLGFHPYCDIGGAVQRAQTFTVHADGVLSSVSYTTAQSGPPDAPVRLRLARLTPTGQPGETLAAVDVSPTNVSWSPSFVTLPTSVHVTAGDQFALVISSATTRGCYAMAYADSNPYPSGGALYSNDSGATWRPENGRDLHFRTQVS
jgi:glycosyl hydrolase family 43